MYLPYDKHIDARVLAGIYRNTTATYKFYWFASILDLMVKEAKVKMTFWEIIIGMVAQAWYPIHYFRISFGASDSLSNRIIRLQQELYIPIDVELEQLKSTLHENLNNPKVKSLLAIFTAHVPYRFLSPWIPHNSNEQVEAQSRSFHNYCLYAIDGDQIQINPLWVSYLHDNYVILKEFTFWNLALFLQKRNPNVPDLASKLIKPIQRESMGSQRKFWNRFIKELGYIDCIYSGKRLQVGQYAIDHFIPWSFVSHNLLWNLLPVDRGINSAKSNDLPKLDVFLPAFAQTHQEALRDAYHRNPNSTLLEDYLVLYPSLSDLAALSQEDFYDVYRRTCAPLVQIAENMGFTYWKSELYGV